jgi:hypothetical protein
VAGWTFSVACNVHSDPVASSSTNPVLKSEITMKTSIRVDGSLLVVSYVVANESRADIYVLDVLWAQSGEEQPFTDPKMAYASITDDGLLHLARAVPPVPQSKFVEFTIVPFAHRVPPGDTYSSTFEVPLPVAEYNPYFPERKSNAYETVTASQVKFELTWLSDDGDLRVEDSPIAGALGITHPKLLTVIKSLESEAFDLDVPVQRRTDKFERF